MSHRMRIIISEIMMLKDTSRWFKTIMLSVIIVVSSGLIYSITKANSLSSSSFESVQNFSAVGMVTNISPKLISLIDDKDLGNASTTALVFDLSSVTKIETNSYRSLSISDINIGDRVIIQGVKKNGSLVIQRIISFAAIGKLPNALIATTTEEFVIATTTFSTNISSSTDITDNTATTTDDSSMATSTTKIIDSGSQNNIASSTESFVISTSTPIDVIPTPTAASSTPVVTSPIPSMDPEASPSPETPVIPVEPAVNVSPVEPLTSTAPEVPSTSVAPSDPVIPAATE